MKRCLVFVPLEKYIFLIILFKPKTALKKKSKKNTSRERMRAQVRPSDWLCHQGVSKINKLGEDID